MFTLKPVTSSLISAPFPAKCMCNILKYKQQGHFPKSILLGLLFLGMGCMLAGCANEAEHTGTATASQADDFAHVDTLVRYAEGFDFVATENTICLRLFDLEKRDGSVLCRVCRGEPQPDALGAPTVVLPKQTIRLATVSTTHIALLSAIGGLSSVVGTVYADRILDTDAKRLIQQKKIADLSGEHDLDTERTLLANPDVVTSYPFGGLQYPVLETAGIGVVPLSEYLETHPLGRTEWMKVMGFLTNRSTTADSVFESVEARYNALVALTAALPEAERPLLYTGSHANGQWFAPPANSFMGRFSEDAGGRYLFADAVENSNLTLDFEQFIVRAIDADYWGRVVYTPGALTYTDIAEEDPRYTALRAFRERKVFYCNAAETDYFGRAITEPDAVLADLISIVHPKLLPDHLPQYFKPVAE